MVAQRNTAIALRPSGTAMMSIDIRVDVTDRNTSSLPSSATAEVHKSMARLAGEAANVCLDRLRLLLAPPTQKSAAKKGSGQRLSKEEQLAACPPVHFVMRANSNSATATADESGRPLSKPCAEATMPNSDFWPNVEQLIVGDVAVRVHYNLPTVTRVVPPASIVVGMPTMCSDVQVLFSSSGELLHEWRARSTSDRDVYDILSTDRVAVPTAAWVGRSLTYRCRPQRSGESSEEGFWVEVDLPAVQAAEPPQPRWALTSKRAADASGDSRAFRVVSYNILHDAFASTNYAKYKLYPFASEEVLNLHSRKVCIARELMELRGDIVCLRECGATLFDTYLNSFLETQGYSALYTNKSGTAREGCATAFRTDRFQCLHSTSAPLVMGTLRKYHEALATTIESNHPHLDEALQRVTSVGSVALLKDLRHASSPSQLAPDSNPSTGHCGGASIVAVANTHLFYHPHACHIRAIQAFLLLHLVDDTIRQFVEKNPTIRREDIAVVVCGDCNFTRTTGGYRLMTTGAVDDANSCWEKGWQFWWNRSKQEEANVEELGNGAADDGEGDITATCGGVATTPPSFLQGPPTSVFTGTLRSPFPQGLTDTHADDPALRWTNYTLNFKEIIDHIFIDNVALRKLSTVPMPSEAEVSKNVAIPSRTFPSDHLPLIADVTFVR